MLRAIVRFGRRVFVVIFSIVTLVFFLQRMIPGSPADAVLGPDAPSVEKQEWMRLNGFDQPLIKQYGSAMFRLAHGDLGRRIVDGKPIAPQLLDRFGMTVRLALSAFCVSLMFALIFAIFSSLRAGTPADHVLAILSLLMISSPVYISGTILLWLFAVRWDVLPLTGGVGAASLVLPSLTLGAALAASSGRMLRRSILDVLSEDYIRTAYAKGLSKMTVYMKHALRNALQPALSILGLQLAGLLGGVVITEQVFTWPGLGSLMIEAVYQRDYNLVSACVVVLAMVHVSVSALTDALQRAADPRSGLLS